jgi:hypothetical protein
VYGWSFRPMNQGVSISLDKTEHAHGQQSLRLSFDGKHNPELDAACTYANVQPRTSYYFYGWIKTKNITTENGLEFRIRPSSPTKPGVTATREVHGTNPWTEVDLNWNSPSDTHLVQICVSREASDNPEVRKP